MFRNILLMLILGSVYGHEWKWGPCPKVPAMPNFKMDKFLGKWYVLESFDTYSSCLSKNYKRSDDGSLSVTDSKKPLILGRLGIQLQQHGSLNVPDLRNSAAMIVKYTLNILGNSEYIVAASDYDHYAMIFECQQRSIPLWNKKFHRQSASFMVRDWELKEGSEHYSKLKKQLEHWGVDTNEFDEVSQEGCNH